jgi:hypothetical protein
MPVGKNLGCVWSFVQSRLESQGFELVLFKDENLSEEHLLQGKRQWKYMNFMIIWYKNILSFKNQLMA